MSTFDLSAILQKRMSQGGGIPTPSTDRPYIPERDGYGKLYELEQANNQKRAELVLLNKRDELRREANKKSLVGQLDLNPDGLVGTAVNSAVQMGDGLTRIVQQIGSGVHDLRAQAIGRGITDADKEAAMREGMGLALPEDTALLDRNTTAPGNPEWMAETARDRIARMKSALGDAQAVRDTIDISSSIHRGAQDDLTDQLKADGASDLKQTADGFNQIKTGDKLEGTKNMVSGVAGLLANVGRVAMDNPKAASEFILNNLPQMGLSAAGTGAMVTTNLAYAVDAFGQGMVEYQKTHGKLPSQEETLKMAGTAATLMAAEVVGDKLVLGAGKAAKAAGDVTPSVTREGFRKSLMGVVDGVTGSAPARIAKSGLEGAAGEFGTEGYQTWAEEKIKGKDASLEDVYVGAAIGAMAGGGTSAGMQTVVSAAESAAKTVDKYNEKAAESADFKEAVKTGDTSAYLDPKNPSFDPAKAVSVLHANSQLDTTPEEAKKANLEKASKIVADLEAQKAVAQESLDAFSPETIQSYKDKIEKIQEKLAQVPPTDTAEVARLTENASKLQDEITSLEGDTKGKATLERRMAKIDKHLGAAALRRDELASYLQPKASEMDSEVALADATPDVNDPVSVAASKDAVERVMTLAMASTGGLSHQAATQLAANTSNGLTDAQRALLRTFSEARIAENRLKTGSKVSQEIYAGGPGNVGIAQYQSKMAAALAANDQGMARSQVVGLHKFAQDHQAKVAAMDLALQGAQNGGTNQIVRIKGGGWEVSKTRLTDPEIAANGGHTLNSPKLQEDIRTEADALSKAAKELRQQYGMKFGKAKAAAPSPASQVQSTKSTVATAVDSQVANATSSTTQLTSGGQKQSNESTVDSTTPASKPDAAVSTKQAEPVAQEEKTAVDEVSTVESGKLSALENKSPEGTAYKERNLLADFTTQVVEGLSSATQRPLVAVKNFLSHWSKGTIDVTEFLKNVDQENLTDEQHAALDMFLRNAKEWEKRITKNLVKGSRGNDYKPAYLSDPIQFLQHEVTESGRTRAELEENVKTAISYAAFSSILDMAGKGRFNTPQDINRILMRDKDVTPSKEDWAVLGLVGTNENVMRNSMGQKAVAALGFKATKGATPDLISKLESSLGAHVEKLLLDLQYLERTSVSAAVMNSLLPAKLQAPQVTNRQGKLVDSNVQHKFLRLARDDQHQLISKTDEIVKSSKGSQSILDKLFGVESRAKDPSFEPIPFVQKFAKKTRQAVPKLLTKVLTEKNAEANYLHEDKWNLLSNLPFDLVMQMAGVVSVDADKVHKANRMALEAKNEGLVREYESYLDYVKYVVEPSKNGLEQPLYLSHNVWRQQRVGIDTTTLNPQTSKIHRFLMFRKSWATEIQSSNQEMVDQFKIRAGEGLGIKADKQSNEKSLNEFAAMFDTSSEVPKVKAKAIKLTKAVDALVAQLRGDTLDAQQQQDVAAGVDAGGGAFHSLDALMGLAQQKFAEEGANGKPYTFTSHMVAEVDGVTNGPMLSHLLFGAAYTKQALYKLLNRGGFFEIGHDSREYNVWRGEEDNLDLYESTVSNVMGAMRSLTASNPGIATALAAVTTFTGELVSGDGSVQKAGRNIVKTPITSFIFGSSIKTSVNNMADKFIEGIYSAIEALAAGKSTISREELIAQLNVLLNTPKTRIAEGTTAKQLMELEFSKAQEAALKAAFKATLGAATEVTMKEDFANYSDKRKSFNQTAQLAFELYNAVYEGFRKQIVAESVEKDVKGNPLHELNQEQESELRKRIAKLSPVLHTFMSKNADQIDAGLWMAKTKNTLSKKSAYQSSVKFSTPFEDTITQDPRTGERTQGNFSVSANGGETVSINPGVGMGPMSTHSGDSAISHLTQEGLELLNVHDAVGSGVGGIREAARRMNMNTWKVMLGYSPASEVYEALARTLEGLHELIQEGSMPEGVMENLQTVLKGVAEKNKSSVTKVLGELLYEAKETSTIADRLKYEAMADMGYVSQYALEGGTYEVTESDRAEAKALGEKIVKAPTAKTLAALDAIQALLKPSRESKEQPTKEAAEDSMENAEVLKKPRIQIMQMLEHGMTDETLRKDQQEENAIVLTAMLTEGMDLETATVEKLGRVRAGSLRQYVWNRLKRIPRDYWGVQGTPVNASDADLVRLFESRPSVTLSQLLPYLANKLSSDSSSNMAEFNGRLLRVLSKTVNPAIRIKYITPASSYGQIPDRPAGNARGWFSVKGDKEEIYLLSPDYVHSGLTAETILHELTHAALMGTIENGKTAHPGTDLGMLVAELEELRALAKTHVTQNKLEGFDAALSDVQEFVAWGMSNLDFQKNVLNKISMVSKTKGNPLVTGMKAFIEKMVGLLFRSSAKGKEEILNNGMSVLIGNVSGLFYQASQAKTLVDGVLSHASTTPQEKFNAFTTLQLLRALPNGTTSFGHTKVLEDLMSRIVTNLHGPAGSFKEALMKGQALTAIDVFQKALDTGKAPFASAVMASPFKVSDQEAFAIEQVEATLRAAMEDGASHSTIAYNELVRIYGEMRGKLSAKSFYSGDWATATQQEKDVAQEQYDFLFKIEKANGDRSDYLSRFVAMGLAHEGVKNLLHVPTDRVPETSEDRSVGGYMLNLFQKILEWFRGKITHTYIGQTADTKMHALVDTLVDIEAKRRNAFASKQQRNDLVGSVEDSLKDFADEAKGKIEELGRSDFFKKHKSGFVNVAGSLISTVAGNRVSFLMDGLMEIRNQQFQGIQGVAAGILNNIRGPKELFNKMLRLTKHLEKTRKQIITQTGKFVLNGFVEEGKSLSVDDKAAVSAVFLRTGAHVLMDHYSATELANLLGDNVALRTAIASFEAKLKSFTKFKDYFINQSKDLGYYLATGEVKGEFLMMNAGNIARLYGTPYAGQLSASQVSEAEKIVDVLSSLNALLHSTPKNKHIAREVLLKELARPESEGNGVWNTLHLHQRMEQESLEKLFNGDGALMMKGYTPEIYNPYIDIQIAETGSTDLVDQGYSQGARVAVDPADPEKGERRIFVLRDGGLQPHLTGIFSLKGLGTKGSLKHSGYTNVMDPDGLSAAQLQAQISTRKQAGILAKFRSNPNYNPASVENTFMAPVLNQSGEAVNWRYLMAASTKDNLLERDNSFEKILGSLAGSIYDKQTSHEQNQAAVKALYQQYQEDFAENASAYVLVGPKSTDPELRDIYRLLPEKTRQAIQVTWGKEGMWVRSDMLDINFGYRKLSLATMFEKDKENRTRTEFAFGFAVESMLYTWAKAKLGYTDAEAEKYTRRAAVVVRRTEHIWQAIVQELKDIIVVKTGTVMINNIISNLLLLSMNGVSIADAAKHHVVAWKSAVTYQKDVAEISQLQLKLDTGYMANEAELRTRITQLEDSIARNPVIGLINAGLMPTIVEDVGGEDDLYSYKSQFIRKTERFTSKVNPGVVKAVRTVYMAHDTPVYQKLSQITQLSDFVARYTLYQHLTTRKNKPLSSEAAIQEASESFVNYDVPMHRKMQYTDDMGITMFTKYFLGIQRVIVKLARENPARVMLEVLLNSYVGGLPIVTDSSMIARLGNNPFHSGAFQLPGTLDELATVSATLSLFK